MKLILRGHDCRYACEQMMLTLFPGERPVYEGEEEHWARLTLSPGRTWLTATALLHWQGKDYRACVRAPMTELTGEPLSDERVRQKVLKLAFFRAGCEALGRVPSWGALTGVRPVKLPTKAILAGKSEKEAEQTLLKTYQVHPSRVELAMDCARESVKLCRSLDPKEISLYVGVPFCPTRCAYCSFVSADIGQSLGLLDPFLDVLEAELKAAGDNVARTGHRVRTIYVGGGTPTTLSAPQLDRLLTALETHFDLSGCVECTVEAGRPDTITREKMEVLAKHGVHRVSVNPQSMEDHVLEAMGRSHRAADILRAYEDVRASGSFAVNMDLIAGLPLDTPEGFARTLDRVLALRPENITVHTLALKKGSALMRGESGRLPTAEEVADMLTHAWQTLRKAGYVPYYLYRQKYMSGGFENVGWCLPGQENQYNILMMEELHSVLALGGGGMTKLVDRQKGAIRRVNNPKYPREYIQRAETVCKEKETLTWRID